MKFLILCIITLFFFGCKSTSYFNKREIEIQAYIDGLSELHISQKGIYWKHLEWAKPGMHGGENHPTIINNEKWYPQWQNEDLRSIDTSEVFPIMFKDLNFQIKLSSITFNKELTTLEKRGEIKSRKVKDEFVITFNDTAGGPSWYKIQLIKQ